MERKDKSLFSPYKFFPKLIRWLATDLLNCSQKETAYAVRVTDKILTILKTRGKPETIKYVKALRLKLLRAILCMTEDFNPEDRSSFPSFFKPVFSSILKRKSYPYLRLILSCLYITRFIRLRKGNLSFETITKRPLYKGDPSELRDLIYLFLKEIGVNTKHGLGKVPKSLRFTNFHMTSKSGPNGHALWTSYQDAFAMSPHQCSLIRDVGGDHLYDLMLRFTSLYSKIPMFFDSFSSRKGSRVSRRLSIIDDKEGKQREVAIVSYYEQAALLPLHNYLMKQLSRIRQDCTDNQTKLFYELLPDKGSSYHSIDLTAFTDRFPISINKEILSVWFGDLYAESWRSMMVDTPFDYQGHTVKYETGNPMGAYSSWASTTLAHHFFVFLACKRAKRNWKKCPYMLLGDDIVIANDDVAKEYKEILSEWCIDFSKEKTHTSKYGFEFAKQIRLHGINISPFPLSALFDRKTEALTSLGIIISEIDYKRWDSDIVPGLESYFTKILGWNFPRFKKFLPDLLLIVGLVRYLQGRANLGTSIRKYAIGRGLKLYPHLHDPESPMWAIETGNVVVRTLLHTFQQNYNRVINPKTKGSLGELSTLMVMNITSLRDGGADCFDLIESVPFLQVYGRAEEKFLELQRMLSKEYYDFLPSGYYLYEPENFRKAFIAVDIPLSDEGFYVRHRDVLVNTSSRVSKLLVRNIETIMCETST